VIISDSLGRPRPNLEPPDRTEYEETYGYRLRKHLFPEQEVEIWYVARLNQRSFGFNGNVARYNAILAEVFRDGYIDLDELSGGDPDTYLISDGIHLTGKTRAVVADYLHARMAVQWCRG
jgi:hypothetical protein